MRKALGKIDMDLQIAHSIDEIDPTAWDSLGNAEPFSSHRWHHFGEAVMKDSQPVYFLLWQSGRLVARAAFWVIRSEPLPLQGRLTRSLVQTWFHTRPLFTCRSPLSNFSGLILPDPPLRANALTIIDEAAHREARKYHASFLMYDYLRREQALWEEWQGSLTPYSFADPVMRLEISWEDFDGYLACLSAKERQHYRQRMRVVETGGIEISLEHSQPDLDEALPLIREVESRHHSSPNPWVEGMLRHMDRIDSTWITVRSSGRLLGCELVLRDGDSQMVCALGLEKGISDIYHLLGYADINNAIKTGARWLYWGSGSTETKRRMGFSELENTLVLFDGLNRFDRWLGSRLVP